MIILRVRARGKCDPDAPLNALQCLNVEMDRGRAGGPGPFGRAVMAKINHRTDAEVSAGHRDRGVVSSLNQRPGLIMRRWLHLAEVPCSPLRKGIPEPAQKYVEGATPRMKIGGAFKVYA